MKKCLIMHLPTGLYLKRVAIEKRHTGIMLCYLEEFPSYFYIKSVSSIKNKLINNLGLKGVTPTHSHDMRLFESETQFFSISSSAEFEFIEKTNEV